MGAITDEAAETFRDYVTEGVPASGGHEPVKSEIRGLFAQIEAAMGVLSLGGVDVTKATKALLDADLNWAADSVGLVYADATDANNDLYIKVGGSGSGSWTLTTILHDVIEGAASPFVEQAEAWAEEDEDVEVETGQFSAKHHALKAAASAAELAGVNQSTEAEEDTVTDAGHAIALVDSDGRIQFAIGGDGLLADSGAFIGSIVEQAGIGNTAAAIDRLPRHGISFTFTDWNGVTAQGQSNANGNNSQPLSTVQPFDNSRLSGGVLIDLVETVHETSLPGATAHASDRLLRTLRPWDTFSQRWIGTQMGAGGTGMSGIEQGTTVYNNGKAAVTSIKALANAAVKTYAERAILFLHGETDSDNGVTQAAYLSDLIDLKDDWNTDILAITGQTDRIPMFIAQCASGDGMTDTNKGPLLAMLEAAETDDEIKVIFPGYAARFMGDGLHYSGHDERRIGEYFGKALHRYYIEGKDPSTVRPTSWTLIDARCIELEFFVPVPPLVFDLAQVWPPDVGLGFAVYDSGSLEIAIESVQIIGPTTVRVYTLADVVAGDRITYAVKTYERNETGGIGAGNRRGGRGCLRDSDTTPSYYEDAAGEPYRLENWCVIFDKELT